MSFTSTNPPSRLPSVSKSLTRGCKMKPALRITVVALFASIVSLSAAHAQVPYTQGPVERVTLLSIVPGHSDAFFADFKANVIPIWESEKAAGLITGYQIFLNQTSSNPDWDFGF